MDDSKECLQVISMESLKAIYKQPPQLIGMEPLQKLGKDSL